MSRRKRPPLRQPRGPRATLPPRPPRPEKPTVHDIHLWGTGCEDCERWNDECTCAWRSGGTDGPVPPHCGHEH